MSPQVALSAGVTGRAPVAKSGAAVDVPKQVDLGADVLCALSWQLDLDAGFSVVDVAGSASPRIGLGLFGRF
jgi:hypothetical protein